MRTSAHSAVTHIRVSVAIAATCTALALCSCGVPAVPTTEAAAQPTISPASTANSPLTSISPASTVNSPLTTPALESKYMLLAERFAKDYCPYPVAKMQFKEPTKEIFTISCPDGVMNVSCVDGVCSRLN